MGKKRGTELQRTKERNEKLVQMVKDARDKVEQHEETGRIYAAYMALMLKEMGKTKKEPFVMTRESIKEAMEQMRVIAQVNKDIGVFEMWVE